MHKHFWQVQLGKLQLGSPMPGLWALELGSLGDSDDAELDRDGHGGWHRFGELGTEAVGLGDAGDPRRQQGRGFVPGDGAPKPHAQAARAEQRAEGDGGDGERVDRVVGIDVDERGRWW